MAIESVIASATTFLFVPANRPERFEKAHNTGADAVIIDLEDAVAAGEKEDARRHVVDWLGAHPDAPTVVRINPPGTPAFDADVQALGNRVRAAMLPKVEAASDLLTARQALGRQVALIALLETARGIGQAFDIAAQGAPLRLAFGNVDFAASIGVDAHDERALLFARSQLVIASAAAGIAAPIDGVATTVRDAAAIRDAAQRGRELGFCAKLFIHPAQIEPVKRAYHPTEPEIQWASTIVESIKDGNVAVVNDEMVDLPVIARARQILARASVQGDPK